MGGQFQLANRRVAILSATVLGLSCVSGAVFAGTAFADVGNHGPATVPGTPCTASARACVDLEDQQAWLLRDGQVIRGPVPISSGGAGKETPPGTFRVLAKDKDHKSNEFPLPNGQPAPMPWSVFFEPGGIAFHAGDPQRASAGCIHLNEDDAEAWFNYLQVGNEVQVQQGGHSEDSGDDHGPDSGDDHGEDSGPDDGDDSGH